MRTIQEIKKGMTSKNQDEWVTFEEINWVIEQNERLLKSTLELEKEIKGHIQQNNEYFHKWKEYQEKVEKLEKEIEMLKDYHRTLTKIFDLVEHKEYSDREIIEQIHSLVSWK